MRSVYTHYTAYIVVVGLISGSLSLKAFSLLSVFIVAHVSNILLNFFKALLYIWCKLL